LLIEVVMNWPGLGPLLLEAILARDFYVVVGAVMLLSRISGRWHARGRRSAVPGGSSYSRGGPGVKIQPQNGAAAHRASFVHVAVLLLAFLAPYDSPSKIAKCPMLRPRAFILWMSMTISMLRLSCVSQDPAQILRMTKLKTAQRLSRFTFC